MGAELDATLDAANAPAEAEPGPEPEPAPAASETTETADAPKGETVATEVLVKGLGSFGAITGFRQSLASRIFWLMLAVSGWLVYKRINYQREIDRLRGRVLSYNQNPSGIGVAAFHPEGARYANYASGDRRGTGGADGGQTRTITCGSPSGQRMTCATCTR